MPSAKDNKSPARRKKGFERTSSLLSARIREAGESRGFAVSRVLTHWSEIVGEANAAISRPVDISYARGGMGATLTVLTTGAQAPMLEMQKDQLREKVNAVYGYNAIARVRITQTAATGFAEGQVQFTPAPKPNRQPDAETCAQAALVAEEIGDDGLRNAIEMLARNVLTKKKLQRG